MAGFSYEYARSFISHSEDLIDLCLTSLPLSSYVDRINVNLRVPSFCTKRFLYVEAFKINTKCFYN